VLYWRGLLALTAAARAANLSCTGEPAMDKTLLEQIDGLAAEQLQLDKSRAQLGVARAQLDRQQRLLETQRNRLLEQRRELDTQRAEYSLQRQQLEKQLRGALILLDQQLPQFQDRLHQLAELQHRLYAQLRQQNPQLAAELEDHATQLRQLEAELTATVDPAAADEEIFVGPAAVPAGFPEAQVEALTSYETQATPQDD